MVKSTVFLYPGQGAQHVGMGHDLFKAFSEAKTRFDEADRLLDFSLSRLCFEGPEEKLDQDLNAQLAVYTVSCILTDILREQGVLPEKVTGYSSGFYAAAYAAGCFDYGTGLEIVRQAGEILLDEGRKIDGRMAVIFGLSLEEVERICQKVKGVEISILNTPRQMVISGVETSIGKAMELSLKEGALDAYTLPAETAYHSRFMDQSTARLLEVVKGKEVNDPQIPIISYLTLDPVKSGEALKNVMATQLSGPVLWVDLIGKLRDGGGSFFVEVGPGTVISRSVRWIDRNIEISNTANKKSLLRSIEKFKQDI